MDMVDLVIKIECGKNRRIPYNCFLSVSERIKELLSEVGDALGIEVNTEKWSVGNFRNGSLQYTAMGIVDAGMGHRYRDTLNEAMSISQPKDRKSVV